MNQVTGKHRLLCETLLPRPSPKTRRYTSVEDAEDGTKSRSKIGKKAYSQELLHHLLPRENTKMRPSPPRCGMDMTSHELGPLLQTQVPPPTNREIKNEMYEGQECISASWGSNSAVAPAAPEPDTEINSNTFDFYEEMEPDSASVSVGESTPTKSPVLQWIVARVTDWKQLLNRLPITGTATEHLSNIATALSEIEQEIAVIRMNLQPVNTARPESGEGEADYCGPEDSRVIAHSMIIHEVSNTFLFSFEQLCSFMAELSGWKLGYHLPESMAFWHFKQGEMGAPETPDACATLPEADISQLSCADAQKFVDCVNKIEGKPIFRVQTVHIREQVETDESTW